MEIVNFSDTKIQNIPKQDNPIFDKKECLMLCQSDTDKKLMVLFHINSREKGFFTKIAVFWDKDIALDIAEIYSKIIETKQL